MENGNKFLDNLGEWEILFFTYACHTRVHIVLEDEIFVIFIRLRLILLALLLKQLIFCLIELFLCKVIRVSTLNFAALFQS